MYEYEIMNKETNELRFIWGCNGENAFKRSNLNPNEWYVISCEYVD